MCSEQQVAKTAWCAGGWLMNMIVEHMRRANVGNMASTYNGNNANNEHKW